MPKVVTISSRQAEYEKEGFYIFDKTKGIIMCKYCNSRIDWERKDSCQKHVSNETHKIKKAKALEIPPKRQLSLSESLNTAKKCKIDKEEFILETTEAFLKSNIPLEKLDAPNLREWMEKYVPGSKDLPTANWLRTRYVGKIVDVRQEHIKNVLKDLPVVVLCDETTDRMGRCVFVMLLRPLTGNKEQQVYVGGVKVLENANGAECSRAILKMVTQHNIQFENVIAIVTDSARYMTSCVNALKVPFSSEMVHIQCWAHKLNLVATMWSSLLPELNNCVIQVKTLFLNTRKRKHLYLGYLRETYPNNEKKAILFPSPVMTRWTSWFRSAEYIGEYVEDIVGFCKDIDEGGCSVQYLKALTKDEIAIIKCCVMFLLEHCKIIIDTIVILEGSSYPYAHRVYSKMNDLLNGFDIVSNGNFGECTNNHVSKLSTTLKQSAVRQQLMKLGLKCKTKLLSLMAEDTGRIFLHSLGNLFDMRNVTTTEIGQSLVTIAKKIPLLSNVPSKELLEGYAAFQKKIKDLCDAGKEEIDIRDVLQGLGVDHPQFSLRCLQAIWVPASNVDSERAFSVYSNIVTDLRTNLTPENIETMLAMSFENKC